MSDTRNIRINAELLAALEGIEVLWARPGEDINAAFERVADIFHRETGYLHPGKDCVINPPEVRRAVFDSWIASKRDVARAAIGKAHP